SRLFVLKDPRICRFFPFWRDVVEEFGAAPAVAIPVRNPLEVMGSLRRRDGFPQSKAALLWLRHVIDAERATRDLPRAIVTYDALLSDWQSVIASLAAGLDVSWPRRGAAVDLEIEGFLATQLRHHVATPENLTARAEIVDWVKDTYAALLQLSSKPEHQASKARLDRVGVEFEKASAAFGIALAENEREVARHETESAQIRAHAGALEHRIAALSEVEIAAGKLSAELDSTRAALAAERQAGGEQAARLAAVERDLALAQAGYAEVAEEARRSAAERDALKDAVELAHRTLSAERQRAAEQADQLAELARERERAETSRAAAAEEARQLRAEIAVHARIAAEQSGVIGHFQAIQTRAEQEGAALARRVVELEQALAHEAEARASSVAELEVEVSRLVRENSSLATQLDERTARAARLASDVNAMNRIAETSSATAAARAADLQNDLSAAMLRAAEMERSYHRANSELLAIKRMPGWGLLGQVRRIGESSARRANRRLISRSGLFDHDWYARNYPDVVASASDPVLEYLEQGASAGRDPGPLFLGGWYLEHNPDVRATGMNPLIHFLRHGAREGRNPSPLFETEWYRERYPDVRASGINPLVHYLRYGAAEGRDPSRFFDTAWYLAEHPDVKAAGLNPLAHYLEYGMAEGRRPNRAGTMPPSAPASRMRHWPTHFVPAEPVDRYAAWLACNEFRDAVRRGLMGELESRGERLPRLSVVMPVYNTPRHLLDQAICSVVDQLYEGWELCIADDASTAPGVAESLDCWAAADHRIVVVRRERNGGIGAATNSAAAIARGEFLAFLDHDDLLSPDALAEVAIYAADHSDTDVIYSDDDKIDMDGRRYGPQFKPDWSPVLLLSYMYPSHFLVVRRSLFEALDGIREGFDGSQDYDLVLRASERARHVGHIPRVLYHWRAGPESIASSAEAKPHSFIAGERAVADA
ncbi:MAG: glycosyltransferase, partial [Xanthobacteraceae bacterium]|nr:glycosyltransferase [Xanthobacteraceae bacterium]